MLKGTMLMRTFVFCFFFHLGFWVDDGDSLLADGYAHNIWEI